MALGFMTKDIGYIFNDKPNYNRFVTTVCKFTGPDSIILFRFIFFFKMGLFFIHLFDIR